MQFNANVLDNLKVLFANQFKKRKKQLTIKRTRMLTA